MTMSNPPRHSIRRPVRRAHAENDVLRMLLSFAASVVVTRVFLQLTGFPKLGGDGQFHIAHVLWGGLLLFTATLLPLIFANQWVFPITAILSGLGVGLFIDEVGKFITSTNDYFYPIAAPIIYGFFLLTVLLYFEVRRRRRTDTRGDLYYALSELTEAIDQDLDANEKARIEQHLTKVKNTTTNPVQVQLAQDLLDFLHSDQVVVVEHRLTPLEHRLDILKQREAQFFTQARHRAILIVGMLVFGLLALYEPIHMLFLLPPITDLAARLVELSLIRSSNETLWFILRLILEGVAGAMLLISAVFLIMKQDRRGILLGMAGLLFYLITVNLVVLYFDQFTFILATVVEFGFFMATLRYRQRFLLPREPASTLHL